MTNLVQNFTAHEHESDLTVMIGRYLRTFWTQHSNTFLFIRSLERNGRRN